MEEGGFVYEKWGIQDNSQKKNREKKTNKNNWDKVPQSKRTTRKELINNITGEIWEEEGEYILWLA